MRALSAGWLAKARTDLLACDTLFAQGAELWEAVAFHAQQTVEKALKAVLVAHQAQFSKTHDIERPLDLLAHADPALTHAAADAAELTPFGVEYRYPGEYPPVSRASAASALAIARRVYAEAARRISA